MSRRPKVSLTKEEKEELQRLTDEINEEAKNVVEDYVSNPSQISGSVFEVNEDSPYLDENIEGDGWKKLVKGGISEALSFIKKNKKKLGKKKKKS